MTPEPYRTAAEPEPEEMQRVPALSRRTATILGLMPVLMLGGCQLAASTDNPDSGLILFALWPFSVLVCLVVAVVGALGSNVVPQSEVPSDVPSRMSLLVRVMWGPVVTVAWFFYQLSHINMSRGRQLLRRGRQRLPGLTEVATRSTWPQAAVRGWLENARTEVASVAAFSHLANELLAIGAAPELVEGALRAALEEVEHAKACFQLAGVPYAAGAFPAATWPADRAPTPQRLAASCLRDACVLEHASALVAQRLAARTDLPEEVAQVLTRIAHEEASHAEHGWQILAWLLRRAAGGGETPPRALVTGRNPIGATLAREVAALEAEPPPIRGFDGLESYGLASTDMWTEAVTDALRTARMRIAQMHEPESVHEIAA